MILISHKTLSYDDVGDFDIYNNRYSQLGFHTHTHTHAHTHTHTHIHTHTHTNKHKHTRSHSTCTHTRRICVRGNLH